MSASIDGFVKFWKKQFIGLEYVKKFKVGILNQMKVSFDWDYLGTLSNSKLKIFDIENLDLLN